MIFPFLTRINSAGKTLLNKVLFCIICVRQPQNQPGKSC